MKKLFSSLLILALLLALCPMSAFASETNVWEAVGSKSTVSSPSNVWESVGPKATVSSPSNVWASYDPSAQPVVSTSTTTTPIDWTLDPASESTTTAASTTANAGKVTAISNPEGTLPTSTQGVLTDTSYTMPYAIKVDRTNQVITVFSASEPGVYNVIEKQFICSTGTSQYPTPTGVYTLPDTERRAWRYFKTYDTYVRYAVHIEGNYFFHSLLYSEPDLATRSNTSYRNLGKPASHGCIRMMDEDIKWLAENCLAGTKVFIMDCQRDDALNQSLLPPKL